MVSPRLITVTSQREIKFHNATAKYAYFNLSEFSFFCIRTRANDSLDFKIFEW